VAIGGKLRIEVDVENPEPHEHDVLADPIVHLAKADGSTRPQVVKGAEHSLEARQRTAISKIGSTGALTRRCPEDECLQAAST
jgi:hypothetical protein